MEIQLRVIFNTLKEILPEESHERLNLPLKNIIRISRKCIKGKRNLRDSQRAGPGDSLGLSAAAWDLSADLFTRPSVFLLPEPR